MCSMWTYIYYVNWLDIIDLHANALLYLSIDVRAMFRKSERDWVDFREVGLSLNLSVMMNDDENK